MKFAQDQVQSRNVLTIGKTTVAIMSTVTTVSPASVTRADLDKLSKAAVQVGDWWRVSLEGLDKDVETEAKEELPSEIALELNAWGVSVSDWPPYCLE